MWLWLLGFEGWNAKAGFVMIGSPLKGEIPWIWKDSFEASCLELNYKKGIYEGFGLHANLGLDQTRIGFPNWVYVEQDMIVGAYLFSFEGRICKSLFACVGGGKWSTWRLILNLVANKIEEKKWKH